MNTSSCNKVKTFSTYIHAYIHKYTDTHTHKYKRAHIYMTATTCNNRTNFNKGSSGKSPIASKARISASPAKGRMKSREMTEPYTAYIWSRPVELSLCILICFSVCMYVCMYLCMHLYVSVYMEPPSGAFPVYTYVRKCMYVFLYVFVHTHTHTHTHTVHIYEPSC